MDTTDIDSESTPPVPSLRQTTVRGAKLASIGWVISNGLLFVVYIVLARLITPTAFGRYAAATVITGVGSLFAESGMLSALINRRDRLDEAASTAFFSLLIGGSLLTVGSLLLSPLVGLYFHSHEVELLTAVLSGWLFLAALTVVPDALLQRRFSFGRRVAADPLGALAFAAASIVAAAEGAGPWALVAGGYASVIVQVITVWAFAGFVPRLKQASVAMWRELGVMARPVLVSEMFAKVASQVDAVALGRASGVAPLGQYRNGYRLASQPSLAIVNVASYVLLPALARLSTEPARLAAAARRVVGEVAAVTVPISLAALTLGEPIAVLLLGPRWRVAGHAIAALGGYTAGAALLSVAAELMKVTGQPRSLVRMHAFRLVLLVVTVGGAVVPFGVVGVGAAVSISTCLTGIYGFSRVAGDVQMTWADLAHEYFVPVLGSLVMLAVMFAFTLLTNPVDHREVVGIALSIAEFALGVIAYVAVLLTLDHERRGDVVALLRRLRARARRASD
jgi:PST family polysaccharide transporter